MDEKLLYTFMEAVRGNWRNSIYVVCGTANCREFKDCEGFLLAFGSSGQPIIMPVEYLEKAGDFKLDKSECCVTINKTAFDRVFARWLAWETVSNECVLSKLKNWR